MSALQRVPRRSLPQDVAALGIMVMALESVGWALSVVSSRQVQVYFMGEGVDCLFSWLNGCRALFEHVERIASDLPFSEEREPIGPKAAAMHAECGELFCQLSDAVADDEPGAEGKDILAVPAVTFTRIAANLVDLSTQWLGHRPTIRLIEDIGQCNNEISQWRTLTKEEKATGDS